MVKVLFYQIFFRKAVLRGDAMQSLTGKLR